MEEIFGIDYNAFTKRITIRPSLPQAWKDSGLSIEHLVLPNKERLAVWIENGVVSYSYEGKDFEIIL